MHTRVLSVALVSLLASCGSDDDGGPLTIDNLEGSVIDAFCTFYVRCGLIEDVATCRSLDVDVDIDPDLVAAVNAGKVIFHSDKAGECLAAFNGSTCDTGSSVLRNEPEACDQVFEGTVAEGGACALDEECISQTCVVPTCQPNECCQGTCQGGTPPPARPRVGEACGGGQGSCVASFCDSTTMLCTAPLADNSACTSSSQCASGSCLQQLCRPTVPPGGACSPTAPCGDFSTYCNMTTLTCEPWGLTGDTCASDAECSPIYSCAGTCVLGPLVGDPCSANGGCVDLSYCDATTNICTAPKADGGTCTGDSQCTSRNCDATTGTCTTPPICI